VVFDFVRDKENQDEMFFDVEHLIELDQDQLKYHIDYLLQYHDEQVLIVFDHHLMKDTKIFDDLNHYHMILIEMNQHEDFFFRHIFN